MGLSASWCWSSPTSPTRTSGADTVKIFGSKDLGDSQKYSDVVEWSVFLSCEIPFTSYFNAVECVWLIGFLCMESKTDHIRWVWGDCSA